MNNIISCHNIAVERSAVLVIGEKVKCKENDNTYDNTAYFIEGGAESAKRGRQGSCHACLSLSHKLLVVGFQRGALYIK